MDDALELSTFAVEDEHWWYRGRRRVLHAVLRSLDPPVDGAVLDAGCGSGRNMVELSRYGTVTGIEPSAASVRAARGRGAGEVVQASLAEPLPFPEDRFDLAVALDVLEHVEQDGAALEHLARVVRPSGRLLVTVPQYGWLWGDHDVLSHHHRRYGRGSLLALARSAGWTPERVTSFNTAPLPAVALVRAAQRARGHRQPASDLTRTPPLLNAALERILATEAAWIGAGRDLPAGVSLLAVFRA